MSIPVTNFASKSTMNPLEDDEFSDLTKQEIAFWSHKLKIRPSQLFSLSKDELEIIIQNAIKRENIEENVKKSQHWDQLRKMKRKLIEKQRKERLKGGAGPDLWEILARAAQDIEHMYGTSSFGYNDTSCETNYESSFDDSYPFNDSLYSDEEASYESSPEDYSFNIDENLASTPYGPCGKRQLPTQNTYCLPNPNATYNVHRGNNTYNVQNRQPGNASFDTQNRSRNPTFNCPKTSFKLENVTPPPSMKSTKYSSFNSPCLLANISPPSGIQLDNWSPQQLHHIADNSKVSQATSFRNYTDYSIKYSPVGTEETANSISVEHFDDSSGKVTASSRTFTLPPATTPTSALELSNISPPPLATGCESRRVKGISINTENDLGNITQPLLASGCLRRQPRSNDLSNISPPALASGCRRNVQCPSSRIQLQSPHRTASPSRGDLSNISAPLLASGCVGQTSHNTSKQYREISPQRSYARCPNESSFDIANITAPSDLSTTPRCPLLSAYKAKTPLRVKPNRPYHPRRICEEE